MRKSVLWKAEAGGDRSGQPDKQHRFQAQQVAQAAADHGEDAPQGEHQGAQVPGEQRSGADVAST